MTLKEKFKQWLDTEPRIQIREVQLEVIADDYAIEFAKWTHSEEAQYVEIEDEGLSEDLILKKILEIFKKEKGL